MPGKVQRLEVRADPAQPIQAETTVISVLKYSQHRWGQIWRVYAYPWMVWIANGGLFSVLNMFLNNLIFCPPVA
jgi:hypothetical protein